jgi:hypothetical protein
MLQRKMTTLPRFMARQGRVSTSARPAVANPVTMTVMNGALRQGLSTRALGCSP